MPFRNPQGYARRFNNYQAQGHSHKDIAYGDVLMAPTIERDTFTCGHCQFIQHVHPKDRPEDVGGLCKVCDSLICPKCLTRFAKHGCEPFLKKLEIIEHRERMLLSYLG